MTSPVALSIAGSDPSGGAGIQADLKTFHRHNVFGAAAVTLVTVQDTRGVRRVEVLAPDLVVEQVRGVVEDLAPRAAKTGALGTAAVVEAVAELAGGFAFPLVVDPVTVSKHGDPLMADDGVAALAKLLVPRAAVLTPNIHEAARLTGLEVRDDAGMVAAAHALREAGAKAVFVKGGGLKGRADDLLVAAQGVHWLRAERIDTTALHGTGCVFSAALTARLARGMPLLDAVWRAKDFVERAIRGAPGLGHGTGPIDMLVAAD